MDSILFYGHYFLHLFFGALFILGFFAITRGWKEIKPDGTYEWKGKVFKGWFKFWFQEYEQPKQVFYKGREFLKLMQHIKGVEYAFDVPTAAMIDGKPNPAWILEIEERLMVRILCKPHEDKTILMFYKEEPHYIFPWYIRDMLAGCITCHSSWLGSICFWIPYLLTDKVQTHLLFNFTGYFELSLMLTWVAYCFSLAFVTTGLWKKYM